MSLRQIQQMYILCVRHCDDRAERKIITRSETPLRRTYRCTGAQFRVGDIGLHRLQHARRTPPATKPGDFGLD
jgi:hypothetical protein